jgi:hypothetical protein
MQSILHRTEPHRSGEREILDYSHGSSPARGTNPARGTKDPQFSFLEELNASFDMNRQIWRPVSSKVMFVY